MSYQMNESMEEAENFTKRNEIYSYDAPWTVYSINWTGKHDPQHRSRLAVGSFIEEVENYVQIIQLDEAKDMYVERERFKHQYPPTKIMWVPDTSALKPDFIATSSDYLYLWEVESSNKVVQRAVFDNASNYSSAITSFDWNEVDLNLIGTSSIDTTVTIWDIENRKVNTQLIAHDNEVNDIAFSNQKNIFTTVGADGSVRIFDIRNLEHSTVLYENEINIVRVSWNKHDPCYIAALMIDSSKTILMDVRMPTRTVLDLVGHTQPVNSISFAPHSVCHICTAGEDSKALIWNLARMSHPMDPILCYNAGNPISSLQWSVSQPDWISIAFKQTVQILRV